MPARDDKLRHTEPVEALLTTRLQHSSYSRGSRHCNPWVTAMRERFHPLSKRQKVMAHIREQLPHLRF